MSVGVKITPRDVTNTGWNANKPIHTYALFDRTPNIAGNPTPLLLTTISSASGCKFTTLTYG